ncbi:hypothetical protein [Leptospira santarosai]|uniref:hypothetical protein n=1 Tax=Leptospira santarosai TaxID=28183 RepID=UPI00038132C1|nr:hypothetical protein [Leptospira santarosai]
MKRKISKKSEPEIKVRLLSEAAEKKLNAHINKLYKRMSEFCSKNGFNSSDLTRTLRLVPTPKTPLVLIAVEAGGIKIPNAKRKLLLAGNERASRLKINQEIIDERSPNA